MTDTKTVYAEYRGTSQFEIPFDGHLLRFLFGVATGKEINIIDTLA